MAITKPDELEYDEDIYRELSPRRKEILVRLFNCHCTEIECRPIGKGAFSTDQLRKILASRLLDQTRRFLDHYQTLADENVRTDPAVEYLAQLQDVETDKLNVSSRYELLLLLYEEGLVDELEVLIARSRIREYAAIRGRILPCEIDFEALDERLDSFHEKWNHDLDQSTPIRVETEFRTESVSTFKLYLETGPKHPEVFQFRRDDQSEPPTIPEVTTIEIHQVKTQRLQVERRDSETEVILTKPESGWHTALTQFFATVFGVEDVFSKLEARTSEVAAEVEEEMVEAVKLGNDPLAAAASCIEARSEEAIEDIEKMDLPLETRDDLKDRVQTIEISGSNITDDQSISTSRFQLVATLENLFGTVDGLEEGFRDLIRKADSEKQAFVLTISNRSVEFKDGTWQSLGQGRLPSRDQRALEIFFDSA
ncbi:hypothetical protein [Halopenitus persicus]|uniref:hypothetical protein n=1 Tax=Halopenitus persicus TaxID=1048396 RepID=UPI000BBAEE94|nr:hypothetical protein [Halopenitus persicus]